MRLSTDQNDAGHGAYTQAVASGKKIKILLDGKELREVITADDVEGLVIVTKRDDAGKLVMDYEKGEFVLEELRGDVAIVFEEC